MNPNSFNTVINLETDLVDGEMTEEHRQLIEKAVNRYSKEYYVDPKMSGVKFEGFILVDRSQISKGMYRNQIFRLAGVSPKKLEKLLKDLRKGYRLFEAPPAIFLPKDWQREEHANKGKYRYLTGYQRDECFDDLGDEGIPVTRIVAGLFTIDEDAEVDFKQIGTYLNPPDAPSTPTTLGDLTKIAAEELINGDGTKLSWIYKNNEPDETAMMHSVMAYMRKASLEDYDDNMLSQQAISAIEKAGGKFWNHVNSYTKSKAEKWMKINCPDEYDENGTLKVHYHLVAASSGAEKTYIGPAEDRAEMLYNSQKTTTVTGAPLIDPNFEYRVIVFIPNLVYNKFFTKSASLEEAYNEGVSKFYIKRRDKLRIISQGYFGGKSSKNSFIKLYGAIPSIHGYHGGCDTLCVYDTLKDDGSYICKK